MVQEFFEVSPFEQGHDLCEELCIVKSSVLKHSENLGNWVSYETEGSLNGLDTVVLNIEIGVPSRSPFGILNTERIGISFDPESREHFRACALRRDFPYLPHLHQTPPDSPRHLCLFDSPQIDRIYNETPMDFVIRVKRWLERAAVGELHLDEQGMEPFIMNSVGDLVLDSETWQTIIEGGTNFELYATGVVKPGALNKKYYVECRKTSRVRPETPFAILSLKSEPSRDQCINYHPDNYLDLSVLLKRKLSLDIDHEIFQFISKAYRKKDGSKIYGAKHLIVLICIPRLSSNESLAGHEIIAFHLVDSLMNIAKGLGCIQEKKRKKGPKPIHVIVEGGKRKEADLAKIKSFALSVIHPFSQELARDMAGITAGISDMSFTAIGVGALGSQVILNLARQGFSKWKLIDNDILLPHNFARHGLSAAYRGQSKALALEQELHSILENPSVKAFYDHLDALTDKKKHRKMLDSSIVMDFSASYSVFLHLAYDITTASRCLSAYYCGGGLTSVLLLEASNRSIRLDDIDLQLKTRALDDSIARNIYETRQTNQLVYSTSCSSRTSVMPQDLVGIHAGLIAKEIKQAVFKKDAKVLVNLVSEEGYDVQVRELEPCQVAVCNKGPWQFRISMSVLAEMDEFRSKKLPNETGGVLIGWINSLEKVIYVGKMLPAPPDSTERPYYFIRGKEGLYDKVQQIVLASNHDLYYVGEWHSHPAGSPVAQGGDDLRSMEKLSRCMLIDGRPGVMVILGDNTQLGCYVESRWK